MIFSPLDALLFRRRSRSAQRRVEIFVGLVTIVLGAVGTFAAEDMSRLMRLGLGALCIVGGAQMMIGAKLDRRREQAEAAERAKRESSG